MRTMIKSSGKEIKLVNQTPQPVLNQFLKAINQEEHKSDLDYNGEGLKKVLNFISGGACGKVYELSDDYIVKYNTFGLTDDTPDGEILEALQGLPLIPTVYAYSTDNKYILIQRVKGQTVSDFSYKPKFVLNKFDIEAHDKMVEEMVAGAINRGWCPNDCHASNCMIDEQGKFWVVDVGLFHNVKKSNIWSDSDKYDLKGHGQRVSMKVESMNPAQKVAVKVGGAVGDAMGKVRGALQPQQVKEVSWVTLSGCKCDECKKRRVWLEGIQAVSEKDIHF